MPDEKPYDARFDLGDDELDALIDEWAEVDAMAAGILAEAWPAVHADDPAPAGVAVAVEQVRAGLDRWPTAYFAPDFAAGLPEHADLEEAWLDCAASTISPTEDPTLDRGWQIEEAAVVGSAEHADWLGIVLGSVRRGVGAEVSAEAAYRDLEAMQEIEGDPEDPDDVRSHLDAMLTILSPLWQALGALDGEDRLTEVGLWGLPRALHLVWDQPELDLGLG